MNERIRELAEQAGFYSSEYGNAEESFIKFAELIIKQCGYYADLFETVGCPVDMDPTETKPSDFIKKQLGVEC